MSYAIRSTCLVIFLAASFGFIASLVSEEPPAAPQWEVIAECQMVTLPQKTALPLIRIWATTQRSKRPLPPYSK